MQMRKKMSANLYSAFG